MKKVIIIMGSDSDLPVMQGAISQLRSFGVPFSVRIASAHRTPALAAEIASSAEADGAGVIIAAAGKAAHLAGVLAAHTILPVVAVPVKSSTMDGLDSLLSTVQMPRGIPVACMAIDGSDNAALFAIQMLALSDAGLAEKLHAYKAGLAAKVEQKDREISAEYAQ
ncbi:MAG: 5-(carboxyamino)imidazole ribonucleotide mutase [Clostridiaceae bacterium]|nr:5-(carboxyamino)imidazole ribonucleotide mutase [Clostridiales bacterium]MDD6877338.1 5-(carboxyamino)imidazole ribonucleotide mutase [Clostridiaceae bacterium]MDY3071086.1 5-(carboxyamino)imidazole ribonucleotide mutase [Eubacteriales bacterium]MDY3285969.1 5-(carboxyamino)imidazole ribonucleotide mutase [Eubacteriales bacterium]MDY5015426.1 5-(carboxyamino)imidazole ribonucleotide mutase [Eubacteriales bacterium]